MSGARLDGTVPPQVIERFRSFTGIDVVLALCCPVVLFLGAGLAGGFVGVLGVGLWLLAPVYAFVLAQLALLLVVPEWPGTRQLAVLEGGVALLLLAQLVHERVDRRSVAVFVATALILTGALAVGVGSEVPTWQLSVALLVALSLAAYGVHRYELVLLGLVADGGTEGVDANE